MCRGTSTCMVGGTARLGFPKRVLHFLKEENVADIKIKDEDSRKCGLYCLLDITAGSEVCSIHLKAIYLSFFFRLQ
jgi:hypothetical protein